jgi:hypothetical protein
MSPALEHAGINVCEFEFATYFNFFVKGKPITLVCYPNQGEVLRRIADEIIEGPPDREQFYEDEEYAPDVDPAVFAARPDLYKEVTNSNPNPKPDPDPDPNPNPNPNLNPNPDPNPNPNPNPDPNLHPSPNPNRDPPPSTLHPHQVQHFIAPRPGIPSISSANAVRIVVLEPNAAGVLQAQLPAGTDGGSLAVEQARHQMITR